jgi:hypothetical protein
MLETWDISRIVDSDPRAMTGTSSSSASSKRTEFPQHIVSQREAGHPEADKRLIGSE